LTVANFTRKSMKKILATTLIFSAIGLGVIAFGVGGSPRPNPNADAFTRGPDVDNSSAVVQLQGDPLSTSPQTKPPRGRKIDFNSNAVRSYRAQLNAGRNEFKRWLRTNAPRAKVTGEYDVSLNAVAVQLNGTPLATIAAAPMVQSAEYNALYYPNLSESYKIINASDAWTAAGGRATAGAGIKIGDIDTGIDNNHPFFDPTGFSYPTEGGPWPKCDAADSTTHTPDQNCEYVSQKVIVAKVFYNKSQNQGLDAQAIQDHGTHTAGIAAGVTGKTAVVNGVEIDDMSGIAPGAWLGNYNVFPGGVLNARSEDILNAVDAAIEDGMDVLNLSLGGGYHGNNDLLAMGLDNAVDAGLVVAVAAGNSGPGQGTLESPGRARKIITVGGSTNQHFVGQPFTYPAGGGTTVGAAVGEFDPLPAASFDLFDTHSNGCTSVDPGASGKLAIIDRGTCTFSQKVANANAAGAIAVLIINNVAGDPIAMARTAGFNDDLPAVMISKNNGAALRASGATTASAEATFEEFITPANADIAYGSSSQGPTLVDFAVKPDIASVAVNVLSSITCVGTDFPCNTTGNGTDAPWAFFTGTSMATPHIAGGSAVLLDIHSADNWSPAQVKSALVNRADLVVKDAVTGTHDVGPTLQGGGRQNLSVAAVATTWMDPVSASFGRVTVGRPTSVTITLYNPTGTDQTFAVSKLKFTPSTFGGTVPLIWNAGTITPGDDRITVPASVTVPANSSTTLTVTVAAGIGETVQGWINLDGEGDNDLHFAYYAHVGP
jgi:minor extracellular serine protease Vpr